MPLLETIDMLARGAAIGLLLLWAAILMQRWHQPAARMLVLLAISIACHLLAAMRPQPAVGLVLHHLVDVGAGAVPALFWLVARTWFSDETRLGWGSLAVVAGSTALQQLHLHWGLDQGEPVATVTGTAFRLVMFVLAGGGLWIAWRGREDDLVEPRRKLRGTVVAAVGLMVVLVNALEILIFQDVIAYAWRALLTIAIAAVTFTLSLQLFRLTSIDLLGAAPAPQQPSAPAAADPEAQALAAQLQALMATERLYRDDTLTIAALATRIGLPEYRLRRLINQHLGHRNFAAYLNGLRLTEVKAALADPAQRNVPILTIALDAGFGSLAPFNRAFRAAEGMTPTEFRDQAVRG